jgi:hypothetical protein
MNQFSLPNRVICSEPASLPNQGNTSNLVANESASLANQVSLIISAIVLHIWIRPMVTMVTLCDCDMWNNGIWTCLCLKYAWWRVGWSLNTNVLICGQYVLGGAAGIGPLSGQGHPAGGTVRWFPPFSRMMFMFWNDLLIMIYY